MHDETSQKTKAPGLSLSEECVRFAESRRRQRGSIMRKEIVCDDRCGFEFHLPEGTVRSENVTPATSAVDVKCGLMRHALEGEVVRLPGVELGTLRSEV